MGTFYGPVRSNFKTLIHPNHLLHGGDDAVLGTLALFLTAHEVSLDSSVANISDFVLRCPKDEM